MVKILIKKKKNIITSFFKFFSLSFSVFWETFTGLLYIAKFKKAVSFFGSAREVLPEKYYRESEELAAILSKKGFVVITGGSGGIMRSANKGAFRVNRDSVGVNINLPQEQINNSYLTRNKMFNYFFIRKTILSCASEVYIFFPGGFGTLDELFEMLTQVQTGHSSKLPIILYGKDFWSPLVSFIEEKLDAKYNTISEFDKKLFVVMDSVGETERYISSLNIENNRTCQLGSRY